MLAASPPAQTAHQAQGSSALLPDLRLLATADFSVNKPREQNTRTVLSRGRGETPETRQSASHFSLCVDRGPTFDFSLSATAWTVVVQEWSKQPSLPCAGSAVCARGGGGQDPRASRQCVVELPRTRAMHVHIRSSHLRASARHLPHRPRVHSCGPVPTSHAPRMAPLDRILMAPLDRISDARLGMPSRAAVPVLHIWAGALNPRRPFNLRC